MTNEKKVSKKVLEVLNVNGNLATMGFNSDVVAEVNDWKNEGFTNFEISEKIIMYINVMELNSMAIAI
jgi:diacylglycerol kinase family enzyme